MKEIRITLSANIDKEVEILKRATGLSSGELFTKAISVFRILVEAKSEGREIILVETSTRPAERLILPFELKEAYSTELPSPDESRSEAWWQKWFRRFRLR